MSASNAVAVPTQTFDSWVEYVRAVRSGSIRHEDGAYRRFVYETVDSGEQDQLEGCIEHTSRRIGKPCSIAGRRITDGRVEYHGRKVGEVVKIEAEVASEAATTTSTE